MKRGTTSEAGGTADAARAAGTRSRRRCAVRRRSRSRAGLATSWRPPELRRAADFSRARRSRGDSAHFATFLTGRCAQVMPVLHPSRRPPPRRRRLRVRRRASFGCAQCNCRREHHAFLMQARARGRHRRNSEQGGDAAGRSRGTRPTRNSLKSLVFGTPSRAPRLPVGSNATTQRRRRTTARGHLRTASELVGGSDGGSAEDRSRRFGRVLGGGRRQPAVRSARRRAADRRTIRQQAVAARRDARRRSATPSPRRSSWPTFNLDATAKEAVFGAPYVPSPTPRARRRGAGGGARGGTATTTCTSDRALPTPRQGRNARLQRARRRRRRRWCATAPRLAATRGRRRGDARRRSATRGRRRSWRRSARKPETRRVAPDASGMPSDRRAVGGELGKQHVTHADPTTPAGVPAPYTPYATIDAAPAAAPTHPQIVSRRRAPHTSTWRETPATAAASWQTPTRSMRSRPRSRPPVSPASFIGDGGGAADQGVRQHPVWEGAAGVAQVSAKLSSTIVAAVESGRLQIQAAAAEARAVDAGRARQRRCARGGAAAARRVRVEGRWAR